MSRKKSNPGSFDKVLEKIEALTPRHTDQVPWLTSLLDHPDATIRLAALNALVHRFGISDLTAKLLPLLDSETDDDVLLVLISALSTHYRGAKDPTLIKRCQAAVDRLGGSFEGTREALDDAKLRVMLGYDTKQIVTMPMDERLRQLAALNAEIT